MASWPAQAQTNLRQGQIQTWDFLITLSPASSTDEAGSSLLSKCEMSFQSSFLIPGFFRFFLSENRFIFSIYKNNTFITKTFTQSWKVGRLVLKKNHLNSEITTVHILMNVIQVISTYLSIYDYSFAQMGLCFACCSMAGLRLLSSVNANISNWIVPPPSDVPQFHVFLDFGSLSFSLLYLHSEISLHTCCCFFVDLLTPAPRIWC